MRSAHHSFHSEIRYKKRNHGNEGNTNRSISEKDNFQALSVLFSGWLCKVNHANDDGKYSSLSFYRNILVYGYCVEIKSPWVIVPYASEYHVKDCVYVCMCVCVTCSVCSVHVIYLFCFVSFKKKTQSKSQWGKIKSIAHTDLPYCNLQVENRCVCAEDYRLSR